jgi:hypothetical protein
MLAIDDALSGVGEQRHVHVLRCSARVFESVKHSLCDQRLEGPIKMFAKSGHPDANDVDVFH